MRLHLTIKRQRGYYVVKLRLKPTDEVVLKIIHPDEQTVAEILLGTLPYWITQATTKITIIDPTGLWQKLDDSGIIQNTNLH